MDRAGQEREINFTHLPVGSYQLQVEAYRPNMAGSEKTIELNINILPWWQTWWFRLALAAADWWCGLCGVAPFAESGKYA